MGTVLLENPVGSNYLTMEELMLEGGNIFGHPGRKISLSTSPDLSTGKVVIQFLSGVVPFTEMAGFTPFLVQLLALRPSTCLVSGHPPSSNQSSLSPLPLAFSKSSSVVLAFSCHSLQDSEQPSKHYRHPSSVHVHTINSICCC